MQGTDTRKSQSNFMVRKLAASLQTCPPLMIIIQKMESLTVANCAASAVISLYEMK